MNIHEILAQYDLHPPEVTNDGKMRRFHHGKKTGKKNGWIIVHPDGHGGAGVWGTDIKVTFNGKDHKDITPEDRAKWRKEKQERIAAEKEAQKAAAVIARQKWANGTPAGHTHPYLVKKNVKAHGLRVANNNLLIPMKDESGEVVNVQSIWTDGTKLFEPKGKAQGCYYAFGKLTDHIYIGEGYATCATIHEETGHAVVCAFNADNLQCIAELMRRKNPTVEITILADNDQNKRKYGTDELYNPGVEAATRAAQVGADVVMPDFTEEEGAAKLNDFNDLRNTHGSEAVQKALGKPLLRAVDYISLLPHTKSGGKPMSTRQNLEEIFHRLGASAVYNVITHDYEITMPGVESVTDIHANASYGELVSECARFQFPADKIDAFLPTIAGKNAYNPITQWILSKPWDGESRKREFFDTVISTNEHLKEILMNRWMLQAVGGAFSPNGINAQGVLVFQGPQDLGKTTWMMSLVSEHMQKYLKKNVILRLDDKDTIIQCICFWICELGELDATFKKSDLAALKGFITDDLDVVRTPYSKVANKYPRRTTFFGSVNPEEFLNDTTGNRRFWTIKCESLNWQHGLDMQQVWREFYEDYRLGETWHLMPEEKALLNESNARFETGDPINDRIGKHYDWDKMSLATDWLTPTEICFEIGIKNPDQSHTRKAASYVRKMNGNKQEKNRKGFSLLMPPKFATQGELLPPREW